MKNRIKKWLGITDIEDRLTRLEARLSDVDRRVVVNHSQALMSKEANQQELAEINGRLRSMGA